MTISENPEESSAAIVQRHFHWCLAAMLLPVVTLPLEWAAALWHRRDRDTPEHRRWSRWLFALVVSDTVIAGLVIALVATGVWTWETVVYRRPPSATVEPVRIGAMLAPNPEKPEEAQITRVAGDSPAERAGLKGGDVLIDIDGARIESVADAIDRIRAGEPGVPRTFHIRRDGEDAEIVVTPERRSGTRYPTPQFAPVSVPCSVHFRLWAEAFLRWRALWVAAAMMVALWLISRRIQGRAPALWSWVVGAVGAEMVVSALASFGVCLSLGRAIEGMDIIHSLALLAVGFAAMLRMQGAGLLGVRLDPPIGAGRAILLGFLYLAVIGVRLNIVVSAVEAFAHVRLPSPPEQTVVAGFGALSPLGQILLASQVVLVAPIAEEVLFRGVILPRLVPWMGAAWAVVATSAIFAVLHDSFTYQAMGVRAASVFINALILGWARLRTGGLTAPIAIHMIKNAAAVWVNR